MKTLKIVTILGALALALPAYAASITFSPASVTVSPGATVKVSVSVDPQGATVAAVQSQLSYSSSLLTPTAFSFAPTWIPVTRSGYDQMTGGTIIKSAGYPGGFASSTLLGTIMFTATAAGVAHLAVANGSAIYATNGTNALSGAQGAGVITIASARPVAATSTTATAQPATTTSSRSTAATPTATHSAQTVSHPAKAPLAVSATVSGAAAVTTGARLAAATSTASTSTAVQAASSTALTAAAANAVGGGLMNSLWFWIVFALIVLAIIAGAVVWYRRKMRDLA